VKSVANFSSRLAVFVAKKFPVNLGNLWLKNQSIKNNKLCETKPIFETPKTNLSPYTTNGYDNKSPLLTMEKQSQNKPNQTQFQKPHCSVLWTPNGGHPERISELENWLNGQESNLLTTC
jgi:hypothetical protein